MSALVRGPSVAAAAALAHATSPHTCTPPRIPQFHLNGGRPVASSIPATEHSVMTAWPDEAAAIRNMVARFGSGLFACVMDSYDYAAALSEVLPAIASEKVRGRAARRMSRGRHGTP